MLGKLDLDIQSGGTFLIWNLGWGGGGFEVLVVDHERSPVAFPFTGPIKTTWVVTKHPSALRQRPRENRALGGF